MQSSTHQEPSSPPTIAADIPLDVLQVIFKYLLPRHLAMCCRVNKAVSSLALEALYRDLRPTQRNILRLCLKLCNEPTLARRVRSLIIHDNNVDMYLGVISDALLHLPRLTTLVLNIGPSSSWILPSGDACPFRLTTFICAFIYDDHLKTFLSLQNDVKDLTVSALASPHILRAITPQTLPKLVSICAPLSIVQAFVPGRPVRDVTTMSTLGTHGPSIACLSQTTAPLGIQRLMVNFRYIQSAGCEVLAQSVPNLAQLTIEADGIKPDEEDMLEEFTEWMEEYLSYTKNLDRVIIRFFPLLSRIPCQELDFSDMITSIFAASTKLRHVIITFQGYRAKYVCQRLPGQDWYIVND